MAVAGPHQVRPCDRSPLQAGCRPGAGQRGRHAAGQRRRSRAAARVADPGRCAPGRRVAPAPAAAAGPPGTGLAIAHRLEQGNDQVQRRRGRHDAGQRRRSRAAARVVDPGRVRTWPPQCARAGHCCSWSTKCAAFGWSAVVVFSESSKAKNQRTVQQMQDKGSSKSPRGFEWSEPGQDMRR